MRVTSELALEQRFGVGRGDSSRRGDAVALPMGGVKANIGHAEPAAGMTGLLKLSVGLARRTAAPTLRRRQD